MDVKFVSWKEPPLNLPTGYSLASSGHSFSSEFSDCNGLITEGVINGTVVLNQYCECGCPASANKVTKQAAVLDFFSSRYRVGLSGALRRPGTGLLTTILSDNTTVVTYCSYVNRHGGTRSERYCRLARETLTTATESGMALQVSQIARKENVMADALPRGQLHPDEWTLCNEHELEPGLGSPTGRHHHPRDQDLLFDPRGQTTVWFPISALKWYLNRTQDLLGTSTSLFFLLRVPHSAAWEDTLSRCLVEAIRPLATGPGRSMAHNSRGFTASSALFAGFPIVDICKTTAWKTPIASSPATYRTYHRPIWLWSLDDTSSGVPPLGPPTIGQCHSVHRLWGDR
ncbi:hypothetical protein BSL78_12357 [Apostichopus japonicus]|uniref:Uncharacterized protein n=1 Tax=Stichopus japonicus TaxID=307972 RepID=A0A2G8KRY7_STIJA|nr:hypothetical protein BSL78_12357 [Apostichopus japonicus]